MLEEQKSGKASRIKKKRKSLTNLKVKCKRKEKERAAGENKYVLHVHSAIQRAGGRRGKDINWPSSLIGTVRCTAYVLCHGTGGRQERQGQQLAVVAYRDGQVYCIRTSQAA